MVIGVSEENSLRVTEQALYPFGSFISDVGGAAGLILGISILEIIKLTKQCSGFFHKIDKAIYKAKSKNKSIIA